MLVYVYDCSVYSVDGFGDGGDRLCFDGNVMITPGEFGEVYV